MYRSFYTCDHNAWQLPMLWHRDGESTPPVEITVGDTSDPAPDPSITNISLTNITPDAPPSDPGPTNQQIMDAIRENNDGMQSALNAIVSRLETIENRDTAPIVPTEIAEPLEPEPVNDPDPDPDPEPVKKKKSWFF